jgi:hypothetical protein
MKPKIDADCHRPRFGRGRPGDQFDSARKVMQAKARQHHSDGSDRRCCPRLSPLGTRPEVRARFCRYPATKLPGRGRTLFVRVAICAIPFAQWLARRQRPFTAPSGARRRRAFLNAAGQVFSPRHRCQAPFGGSPALAPVRSCWFSGGDRAIDKLGLRTPTWSTTCSSHT